MKILKRKNKLREHNELLTLLINFKSNVNKIMYLTKKNMNLFVTFLQNMSKSK